MIAFPRAVVARLHPRQVVRVPLRMAQAVRAAWTPPAPPRRPITVPRNRPSP
jgi:hypothetical protein